MAAPLSPTTAPSVLVNFTVEAEKVARLATATAQRALNGSATDAGTFAQLTDLECAAAVQAAHHRTNSPVKRANATAANAATRFGGDSLNISNISANTLSPNKATKSSPNQSALSGTADPSSTVLSNTNSPSKFTIADPVSLTSHTEALQQLAVGSPAVDFPSTGPLMDLDTVQQVGATLKVHPGLTHLSLRRSLPTNQSVEAILDALQGNQTLVYLDLADNRIGSILAIKGDEEPPLGALQKIKQFVDDCESIRHFDISGNAFGAAGTELVCQGVRENVSLRVLDLSRNLIGRGPEGADDEAAAVGIEAMREMILKNKFLKSLYLRGNELETTQVEVFTEPLKTTTRLTELDLSNNKLTSTGAAVMAGVLQVNRGLTALDLSDNAIGWKGIAQLAQSLCANTTLRTLTLQKESFGLVKPRPPPKVKSADGEEAEAPEEVDPEEAAAREKEVREATMKKERSSETAITKLSEMLAQNATLRNLDLGFNGLGPKLIAQLASNIAKTNSALESLNVQMNFLCSNVVGEFNGQGIEALADLLHPERSVTPLQSLRLGWNFVQAEGAELLARSLAVNQTLTSLDVSRNFLLDAGIAALVEGLLPNGTVRVLNLSDNGITASGTEQVGRLFQRGESNSITKVNLSDNAISADGFAKLAQTLPGSGLVTISLNRCSIGDPNPMADGSGGVIGNSLGAALAQTPSLCQIEMADNPIAENDLAAVCEVLKADNSTLNELSLWGRRPIDSAKKAELAMAMLQSNTSITALDFGFHGVPEDVMGIIKGALRENYRRMPQIM